MGVPQQKGQQANAMHRDRDYYYDDDYDYDNYGDDGFYSDSEDDYYEEDEANDYSSEEDEIESSEEDEEDETSSEEADSDQNELDRYNIGEHWDPQDQHSMYKHAQYFDLGQQQPVVTRPEDPQSSEEESSVEDEYDSETDDYANPVHRPRRRR